MSLLLINWVVPNCNVGIWQESFIINWQIKGQNRISQNVRESGTTTIYEYCSVGPFRRQMNFKDFFCENVIMEDGGTGILKIKDSTRRQ